MTVKLVYLNSTGGYPQPTATTDTATDLGKLNLTGVGGIALDANAARIANIGTPSVSTDAATKAYVDTVASGLAWLEPVAVVATSAIGLSGSQTVDGQTPGNGTRVLVTGQNGSTADAANGIYVVNTAGAWSRSSDVLKVGSAVFVVSGTSYADTQWALSTPDANPIVPDVTAILFSQVGASVSYVAGNGISIVGNTISAVADTAAGVAVTGSGIAVNADTTAGALQFSGGALQVNAAAAGGVEISGNALQVKIANANQLSASASGLAVEGVPSQFKVNGSAVSANVTATNLNTLTDSSSITNLHKHANIQFVATATSALALGDVVYVDAAGSVDKALSTTSNPVMVAGVASGTISSSTIGAIIASGAVTGLSGLTAGAAYFLSDSAAGGLALYSAITSGNRAIRVGLALSTTALLVNVQDMGIKP